MQNLYDNKEDAFLRHNVFVLSGKAAFAEDELIFANPEAWVTNSLMRLADIVEGNNNIAYTPYCVEYIIMGVHFIDF
ncbi:MAG: hypothetical protein PHZ09_14315 [Eubacteriales bacterium]|nr:hypothetical protein [Eubacteriales bacterium]